MQFRLLAVFFLLLLVIAVPCHAQVIYFQGFETNIDGWTAGGPPFPIRQSSGTHGIMAAAGNFFADAPGPFELTAGGSAFTTWGGYAFTPGCFGTCPGSFPPGGYETKIDIYIDATGTALGQSYVNDTRFDFTSAISQPDGHFRRDFVFNGGFYNDSNPPGTGPRFVFTASNNAGRGNVDPRNPARNPFVISASGWYTFVHHFYNKGGGVLACDLSILDPSGRTLMTWTLSDPTDIIGSTVGGNRYGWFASQEFNFLPIDNAELIILGAQAFSVGYATNLNKGDSVVNITNSGSGGVAGNICVNVYAFDPSEELLACCACPVTPNALVSLSVQGDLITNTLSPQTPTSVVIALVATTPSGGLLSGCDPAQATTDNLAPGMQAWGTTLHALPGAPPTFGLTNPDFLPATLSPAELLHLTSFCGFAESNGSGFGICKSCRAGGLGGSKK